VLHLPLAPTAALGAHTPQHPPAGVTTAALGNEMPQPPFLVKDLECSAK